MKNENFCAMNRREWLWSSGAAAAGLVIASQVGGAFAENAKDRAYGVGICDWTAGARGSIDAFRSAREMGFDGVQVSYVPDNPVLLKEEVRQQYRDASKQYDCTICSLAMGVLNSKPFATDPSAVEWVSDCMDAMAAFQVKPVLLAFFGKGNLKGKPELHKEVARRLKQLAPKAERLGLELGIESTLSAKEHLAIIDAVGSDSVKVYYDVANSFDYGIYDELQLLGKKNLLCEVHMKEKGGKQFGHGVVDFKKVRKVLDDVGYDRWVVAEGGSRETQILNAPYLHQVFG